MQPLFNLNNMRIPVLIVIFLMSCTSTPKVEKHGALSKIKKVDFNTGFKSFSFKKHTINNKEYIGFCDYNTRKKVVLQSLDLKEKYEIDLKKIIEAGNRVVNIELINIDSILILSDYTNQLFLVNKNGDIVKHIDLLPYLNTYKDSTLSFELTSYGNHFLVNDTMAVFRLQTSLRGVEFTTYSDYYGKKQKKSYPLLFKIDNIFADSLKVSFGLFDFNKNFSRPNGFNEWILNYYFLNDDIFVTSIYSDTVYIVGIDDLKIKQKVKVKTDSELKIYTMPILLTDLDKDDNLGNANHLSQGEIVSIEKDLTKNQYYISTYHDPKEKGAFFRSASLIILDSTFNKIDEVEIDTLNYRPEFLLLKEGLLFPEGYSKLRQHKDFNTNTFTLLKYE